MAPHVPLHEQNTSLEAGSRKKRIGEALENRWIELLVLVLIVADVVLVAIEMSIDHHLACIEGDVVTKSPEQTKAMAGLAKLFRDEGIDGPAWTPGDLAKDPIVTYTRTEAISSRVPRLNNNLRSGALSAMSMGATLDVLDAASMLQMAAPEAEKQPGEEPDPEAEPSNEKHSPGAEHHSDAKHKSGAEHHASAKHHSGAEQHSGAEHRSGAHDSHGKAHSAAHGHGAGHGHHEVNEALVCETKNGHHAHHIYHTCHMLSIGILLIFLVELGLKYWISPKHFCESRMHQIDLFVVVFSLIVDIYISYLIESHNDNKQARQTADILMLIVILRFWRVVRIVHGFSEIYNAEKERAEHDQAGVKEENAQLKAIIRRNGLEGELPASSAA